MPSCASTQFIETLTTLIDERIELALTSIATADTTEANGWLTTKDAAQYIGSPCSRIYDLVALGQLVPSRDGVRLKFKRSQLDDYMEGRV